MKQHLVWKEIKDINDLKPGDIVRHEGSFNRQYVVTSNYGDRATAVDSVDITNPGEWLILKGDR